MRCFSSILLSVVALFCLFPGQRALASGTVSAWGLNYDGELGNGTYTTTPPYGTGTAGTVSGLTGVTSIAGGGFHSLALKSDGTVWAWGYNRFGGLGNGTYTNSNTPVQVSGLGGMTAIAGGGLHSLALKSDGTVWDWGDNRYGQLGDGTYTNSNTPVQVSGLSGVTAIAGGEYHSAALKSDGTVWAWGFNADGQLGNGTFTTSPPYGIATPVQVSGLSGVTAIAGGAYFSLALKSDGTVWTWGANGTFAISNTPVQVSGLIGMTAIAGGFVHSLALKSDGTVWTWGDNSYGELGNGTYTNSNTPVQVSGLSGVTAIAGGEFHSRASKSDGTVWTWGDNSYGELGNGTYTSSNTPVQVSGLAGVTAIAGGLDHGLALVSDTTPPVVTLAFPAPPGGQAGFFKAGQTPVGGSVSATDPSNVTAISCLDNLGGLTAGPLSGGGTGTATRTVYANGDGVHTINCTATDGASNTGAAVGSINTAAVKIDTTPPTVTYTGNAGTYTVDQTVNITCAAMDVLSSVASTTCANISGPAYSFSLGTNNFSATATDNAGNVGNNSTSFIVKVTYNSLINLVNLFVTKPGVAADMVATLQGAQTAAANGNVKLAHTQLNSFINQVSAQSGKSMTATQAAILIPCADALM